MFGGASMFSLIMAAVFLFFLALFRPVSFDVAVSGEVLLSLPVTNYGSPAATGTHKFFVKFVRGSCITLTKAS